MFKNIFNYVLIAVLTMLIVVTIIGVLMMNQSPFLREAYCIFWLCVTLFGYVGMALIINATKR
jgi:uncharacterized membrane protein